jgi:CheY-like chemotaxis protein
VNLETHELEVLRGDQGAERDSMRCYLLVDDNLAFAENVAEILEDEGAKAAVAGSGEQALALLATRRFDALVTDMMMPSMSGAELLKRMREIEPGLPALVVSAYTSGDELRTACEQGLLAVLSKPVPLKELLHLLECARRDAIVVVVEDDALFADTLADVLRDGGFSPVTVRSLPETERLQGLKPFAALVDLRLPGSADGAALLRIGQLFPSLPRLVMTGFPEAMPVDEEATQIFAKPFSAEMLIRTLDRLHAERAAA